MDAVYHALIAEKFLPAYLEHEAVEHTDTHGWPAAERLAFAKRQLTAQQVLPIYRSLLFPEDETVG